MRNENEGGRDWICIGSETEGNICYSNRLVRDIVVTLSILYIPVLYVTV